MNFIKKIFNGQVDESVHKQFIRFGKGEYSNRAVISSWKSKKIKIRSSFEFANDLVLFVSELTEARFKGVVLSKENLKEKDFWVKLDNCGILENMKKGIYVYTIENLNSSQVKEISKHIYYMLLDGEGERIKLKIKKNLPKPGKDENKIDSKFCQLEADEKYYNKIKEDFFWDLPECKKAKISHKFIINEIILPENEKDFAKMREVAKRKGRIIRIAEVDGKEIKSEKEFEV